MRAFLGEEPSRVSPRRGSPRAASPRGCVVYHVHGAHRVDAARSQQQLVGVESHARHRPLRLVRQE